MAETINRHMPAYIVARITALLNLDSEPLHGSRILLLGVTYKRDIADLRGSPAPVLAELLIDAGADVWFHDPHVSTWVVDGREVPRADELEPALSAADVTILLQDHREYELDLVASHARRLFDTRGVTRGPRIARL